MIIYYWVLFKLVPLWTATLVDSSSVDIWDSCQVVNHVPSWTVLIWKWWKVVQDNFCAWVFCLHLPRRNLANMIVLAMTYALVYLRFDWPSDIHNCDVTAVLTLWILLSIKCESWHAQHLHISNIWPTPNWQVGWIAVSSTVYGAIGSSLWIF
jgi:hypothetical protein